MCHESTGGGAGRTIGIGKGSVTLDDLHEADLIVISGQNPGTNHPRMLTALEIAKRNGARILAINPLPEAGLMRFDNPQTPRGLAGTAPSSPTVYCRSARTATWRCSRRSARCCSRPSDGASAGRVVDHDFIERHTVGFDAWAAHVAAAGPGRRAGRHRPDPGARSRPPPDCSPASRRIVLCWAMGITQHRNAVATIKEFVNVALLQGIIGKPGAGLCPVRGHSNVQGDRTMGIWEKPPAHFLDRLRAEFGFDPPREHGLDAVDAVRAFRDGKAKVFVALGGNFVQAASGHRGHRGRDALGGR